MQVKVLVVIVDVEAQEPPRRIGLGGGSSQDGEPGGQEIASQSRMDKSRTRGFIGCLTVALLVPSSSPTMPGSGLGNA